MLNATTEQVTAVAGDLRPVRARRKDTMVRLPLRCGDWSAMLKSYRYATTAPNTSNRVWPGCKACANLTGPIARAVLFCTRVGIRQTPHEAAFHQPVPFASKEWKALSLA